MEPIQVQPDAVEEQVSRPRNPIACESCRTSKTRCYPSERAGICQRCLKSRLNCASRAVQHPKRTRKLAARGQDAGLKCASSSALSSEGNDNTDFRLDLPSMEYPDDSDAFVALKSHHEESFERTLHLDESECPWPQSAGLAPRTVLPGLISPQNTPPERPVRFVEKRTLGIELAKELLSSFHDMSTFFPFVVVPKTATVPLMAKNSPFLLLSLITAASSKDVELHHQLDHEFRKVLSSKVVLDGQRSLDFLQGLLVYIAWYPSYLKMGNQQAFMYMNLAISIAVDLGLDQPRQETKSPFALNNTSTEGLFSYGSFSKAAQRAYLGCYYLSSLVAEAFSKPSSLKLSEILEHYGKVLAEAPEYQSDLSLLPHVKARSIVQRVSESLKPQRSAPFGSPPFNAEAHVRGFQFEADEWRNSLPGEVANSPSVVLAERYLNVSVFGYDLLLGRTTKQQREWLACSSGYMSVPDLWRCLEGVKKFLEYFVSIPTSQFRYMTSTGWAQVVQVIVVLSRISFPILASPNWNSQAARDYAPMGMYLDCLSYKLQSISTTVSGGSGIPARLDSPFIFKTILETLKEAHDRRVNQLVSNLPTPDMSFGTDSNPGITSSRNSNGSVKLCPMFNPTIAPYLDAWQASKDEILLASNEMNLVNTSEKTTLTPIYHDMWATMTMSWALD